MTASLADLLESQMRLSSIPHMALTPTYILLHQAYQQQDQPPSLATNRHKMPLSFFKFFLLVCMHQVVPYKLHFSISSSAHTNMCVEISNNSVFCLTKTPPGRHSMRSELQNVLGIEEISTNARVVELPSSVIHSRSAKWLPFW